MTDWKPEVYNAVDDTITAVHYDPSAEQAVERLHLLKERIENIVRWGMRLMDGKTCGVLSFNNRSVSDSDEYCRFEAYRFGDEVIVEALN
jgi:hypothetical protein